MQLSFPILYGIEMKAYLKKKKKKANQKISPLSNNFEQKY